MLSHEVISMAVQHHRRRPQPSLRWALGQIVPRVARAVRAAHEEQVRMWELWWLTSRVAVDRDGPLAWTPSLDGWRLTGSYLPGFTGGDAAGQP
jgi:hypothetical protein